MHIRKLELHGFKSFPDRTVFHFSSGISGVVGPNGCGKSNVVDAVRWCLGEQRPKQLRGQAMQDIIFAGSAERDPMTVASVTLHFEAQDEPFPGDYARLDELQVTRRLGRDGSSEYLINHQKVRLRDIQELFLDSGAANPLYSFIEQGRIGQIVRAKPEERRTLIEEAAGISRYKLKRKETEQRLSATQDNLDRAAEVVAGQAARLKKLERQVNKAMKYHRLRALIRQGEVIVGLSRYAAMSADRRALSERGRAIVAEEGAALRAVERAVERQAGHRNRLRKLEEEVAVVRERRSELEASRRERVSARDHQARERTELEQRKRALIVRRRQTQEEGGGAKAREERTRGELAEVAETLGGQEVLVEAVGAEVRELEGALRERRRRVDVARARSVDLAGKKARAEASVSTAESRLTDIATSRERLEAQSAEAGGDLAGLVEGIVSLEATEGTATHGAAEARKAAQAVQQELMAADSARADAQRARRAADRAVADAERATTRLQARYESLLALQEARGEVGDGARRLLGRPGVLGVLAELLEVPTAVEPQLMALLGPRLDAIVVEPDGLDGVLAISIDERVPLLVVPSADAELPALPPELVEVSGRGPALRALRALLGGARFTYDAVEAVDSASRDGHVVGIQGHGGGPAVAQAGRVVEVGRAGAAGVEVLRRKRELAELRGRLDQARETETAAIEVLGGARKALAEAERVREEIEARLRDARKVAGEREMELGAVRRRLSDHRRMLEREKGRAGRLVRELERLAREHSEATTARGEAQAALIVHAESAERVEEELTAEQAELTRQSATVDVRRRQFSELHASVAALRERQAALQTGLQAAVAAGEGATRLLLELDAEQGRVTERAEVLANDLDRLAMELSAIENRRSDVDVELVQFKSALEAGRQESDNLASAVEASRDAREAVSARRSENVQASAVVKEAIRQLRTMMQELHELSVSGLLDRVDRDGSVTVEAGDAASGPLQSNSIEDLRITRAMLDDEEVLQEWTECLDASRKSVQRLGAVNLVAVDEYNELSAEHSAREAQRADLEQSLRAIRRTLARLNRVSRERFRDTYERVNGIFQEMYPRLVGGGKAALGLTNEDDLLETGVEVYVQPPGKRLQSLTLLSGGETAMVAIALIFSLFRVKPSPFCLLDEVDAPLDEANGSRFNSMLAEMADLSQFIVITHNKKTMECVDTLYGVTMTAPGVSRLVTVSLDGDRPDSRVP